MNIIRLPFCYTCGVPHVPDDIAERVRNGEDITIEIILNTQGLAKNVLEWGCGGLNIDACRVEGAPRTTHAEGNIRTRTNGPTMNEGFKTGAYPVASGRFPSHLLLSHSPTCRKTGTRRVKHGGGTSEASKTSQRGAMFGSVHQERYWYADADGMELVDEFICSASCPVRILDEQAGVRKVGTRTRTKTNNSAIFGNGHSDAIVGTAEGYDDGSNVSRFFTTFPPEPFEPDPDALMIYTPKASRADRSSNGTVNNTHPTTKNTKLMSWLCRLITPPGGTVLDMFAGSGSTLVAAILEGFDCVGVEAEAEYIAIARARCEWAMSQRPAAEQLRMVV